MPVVHVHMENGERYISFAPGASLLEILNTAGVQLRSGCGGVGTCGLCRIQIVSGETERPTVTEKKRLTADQLQQEIRLACQVRAQQDLGLRIVSAPGSPDWRCLSEIDYTPFRSGGSRRNPHRTRGEETPRLGVAVDLGTTNICLALCDLATGQHLAGLAGQNPQTAFGSDVMTRLAAAAASDQTAGEISLLARQAIGEALRVLVCEAGCELRKIDRVLVVGNSAMLALLSGRNYHLLLQPDFWDREIDCLPLETRSWRDAWGLHQQAAIELIPPLAGFVGSDLLTGLLATQLNAQTAGSLFVDFGTNSEIALWDGGRLWVTSAAGGPAFEGCGISCGMPAEPGAVCRAEPKGTEPGFSLEVIGGGTATGVCGSALVDVIACLIKDGTLNRIGRFRQDIPKEGFVLSRDNETIAVNKSDIDLFQRAKAAIGAGIAALLNQSGLSLPALHRIYVCGAFGRFLNVSHAQEIGLLPEVPLKMVTLCGNTALAGCERLLLSGDRFAILSSLKAPTRMFNLAQVPEFERLFVENLYLRPMRIP